MLPDEVASQPELVGVNSMVVEEYDPARPNDYEYYRREKKRKAMEAERLREIERRRQEEEEEMEREREKDRDKDVNISGEEVWRRRVAMSGEDDGEDEVEGRARIGETGARDYDAIDGEEQGC
ncbi:DNA-damage-repair/toleration protein DRT111 chloroplastic-like [Populus alba x Populus x berolinensis]|uniref:DNA-damage-repair/toleration protein DRT111 chloroplastic-like n=1 Tax=Populus alba x Populus x berolinensis TaxID=444605 RepID=A0AAD6W3H0_9ROSI|nr:DNA-damage-repair/toleration protein DRT111 chloroplastic-like [Populus alba x Populus x berolinensis]